MLLSTLASLLRAPVGNNFQNNPEDVRNLKTNFKTLGLYAPEVENGYIDSDLRDAMFAFQQDNGLKVDGYARPGGETEATMIGRIMGIPGAPEASRSPLYTEAQAVPILRSTIPPLIGALGAVLAKPAQDMWEHWQGMTTDEREGALDRLECERMYHRDTQTCNRVTGTKVAAAGRICHASASERYAACLAGKPYDQWPDLQD